MKINYTLNKELIEIDENLKILIEKIKKNCFLFNNLKEVTTSTLTRSMASHSLG